MQQPHPKLDAKEATATILNLGAVLSGADNRGHQVPAQQQGYPPRVLFLSYHSLKLGNLMINEEMQVKIGDFGLAAKL